MPWATIGAAVIGGVITGEASKRAGNQAASGQREAIAEQRRQFDETQKQQAPWLEAGEGALGRYEDMLGKQGDYESQIQSNVPERFQYGGSIPEAYKSQTNIPGAYQSQTNVPGAYQSSSSIPESFRYGKDVPQEFRSTSNVPQAYSDQAGDYFGKVQSDVQPGFQFGRQEFDQYKDPGYDFRMEEGLKALERRNAKGGQRNSGYNTRSLMELGQNLGSQEFGAARDRAYGDYQSKVASEQERYGRSVGDYGRRTGRESELYGRGRQQRQDETGREQTYYGRDLQQNQDRLRRDELSYGRGRTENLDAVRRDEAMYGRGQTTRQQNVYQEQQMYGRGRQQRADEIAQEQAGYGRGRQYVQDQASREQQQYGRSLRDYGFGVDQEQATYGRSLDRYGRQYSDMMNRESALANVGQTTATNLGNARAGMSQNIGQMIGQAGAYNAAGSLGQAGAYAGAIGAAGQAYRNRNAMDYSATTPGMRSTQDQMLSQQWNSNWNKDA